MQGPELDDFVAPIRAEAVVDFGATQLVIGFDRQKVTPAWQRDALERDEKQDPLSVPRAIMDLALDWNMVHQGQPVELTEETLARIPYWSQDRILAALLRAAVPSDAEGKGSSPMPNATPLVVPPLPAKSSPQNGAATETSQKSSSAPSTS